MVNYGANTQQYNHDHRPAILELDSDANFGNYDLMSMCGGEAGTIIKNMRIYDLDNVELSTYEKTLSDGGGLYNKRYATRNLSITLFIQKGSHGEIIQEIDALKSLTRKTDILRVKFDGETREQKAILEGISVGDIGQEDFADDVRLDFVLLDGYWSTKDQEIVDFQNVTAGFDAQVFNGGRYATYPIVAIQFTTATLSEMTIDTHKVGELTGYIVEIKEAITDGDFLVVDYKNKEVTLNGNPIQFYGPLMPMEDLGYNILSFDFTGTVDCSINILYNKTYL